MYQFDLNFDLLYSILHDKKMCKLILIYRKYLFTLMCLRNKIWITVVYRLINNGLESQAVVNNKHQNDKLLFMSRYMMVFYILFWF